MPKEGMDLVRGFALALPLAIIGELPGVPQRDRRALRGGSRLEALAPLSTFPSVPRKQATGSVRTS
ncbi:MAG TPA: hypothetical protein VGK31_13335 [Thermoanaerobaculia bacterium]